MDSKKTIIRKALQGDGYLPTKGAGTVKILSGQCVNSRWTADWLARGEGCQCAFMIGFKCKVRIEAKRSETAAPYEFIVDKGELYKLIK